MNIFINERWPFLNDWWGLGCRLSGSVALSSLSREVGELEERG